MKLYQQFFTACFILLILLGVNRNIQAQVILQDGYTPEELVEAIISEGVAISNVEMNCPDGAYGIFNAEGTTLGTGGTIPFPMGDGIILTSGEVIGDNGPQGENVGDGTGIDNFGAGYGLLDSISGFQTFNACVLEFDIIPQGTELSFNYTFGSDEYDEYVCAGVNDAFGFFISGPNPDGGDYSNDNIAIIPGTDVPVSINSVNNGTVGVNGDPFNCISLDYEDFFVSNPIGSPDFEYDGFTTLLTATANVVPCETYHLIIAISDAGDGVWDSGVFLEGGSFASVPDFTVTASSVIGSPTAIEGCIDVIFTVSTDNEIEDPIDVEYTISGTAESGVDYEELSGIVNLTPAQNSVDVTISALVDDLAEEGDTITISVSNIEGCEESSQSVNIAILDAPEIDLGPDGIVCEPITLDASNDLLQDYLWSTGSTSSTIEVTEAGTYWVSVGAGCVTDTIVLEGAPAPVLDLGEDQVICDGTEVVLDATVVDGETYLWSDGSTSPTLTITTSGTYSVEVMNACGIATDEVSITLAESISVDLGADVDVCFGELVTLDATTAGATSYAWSNGSTEASINITDPGEYTCEVTGECGTVTDDVLVSITPELSVDLGGDKDYCVQDVNVLDATTAGATSYLWSNGSTGPSIVVTETGVYSVAVSNECGTVSDEICAIVQSCLPVCESIDVRHLVTCDDISQSYQVFLSISGGVAPYTVSGDINTVLAEDNVETFGPFPFEEFYQFNVTDGQGCLRSVLGKPLCLTTPVELVNFDGRTQNNGNLLAWKAASEVNNAFYTLEKSNDGTRYQTIDVQTGAGTTSTAQAYQFLDTKITNGTSYYRLSQTDVDGTSKHLGNVVLNRRATKEALSFNYVQPVPAQNNIQVSYNAIQNQALQLSIYDITGRVVVQQSLEAVAGSNNLNVDISVMSSGIYTLVISDIANGQRIVQKMVKE